MNPELLVFLFLAAGIFLIFLEFVVPSGGMIAVMCVCCLAGSAWFAYKAWYVAHPGVWWVYLTGMIALIPATIYGVVHLLQNTSLGNRILLSAPSEQEVTPYQKEVDYLSSLIGKRGRALNLMTPGGMVLVGNERLHAITDGLMIEPNTEIEIVAVRGTRVVVRPVETLQVAATPDSVASFPASDEPEGVDPFADDETV